MAGGWRRKGGWSRRSCRNRIRRRRERVALSICLRVVRGVSPKTLLLGHVSPVCLGVVVRDRRDTAAAVERAESGSRRHRSKISKIPCLLLGNTPVRVVTEWLLGWVAWLWRLLLVLLLVLLLEHRVHR